MTEPTRLLLSFPVEASERLALREALPNVGWASWEADASRNWPDVEALLVGDARRELRAWLPDRAPRLRLIQCSQTGVDSFPFDQFPPPIQIAGNGGAYAPFVAERALALLLSLNHHLPENERAVQEGRLRPAIDNAYLWGSTVLILGFGEIGHAVGERVRACGAHVIAVTRDGSQPPGAERAYASGALLEALAAADAVIECRPLTNRTRGTLNAAALAAMKPSARLINVGRAATIDEAALYERLASTPTFAAASDVWWEESFGSGKLTTRFPFGELPNFLGTPHNAAFGLGSDERGFRCALTNLRLFFDGAPPRFLADRSEYV